MRKRARLLGLLLLVLPFLAAASVPAWAQEPRQPRPASLARVVGHAAGGAIIGGWTGYVGSQVTWSDWHDGAGRGAHRLRFSVTGAALGLVAGVMVGRRARGAAPVPGERPSVAPLPNTGPITAEEIRTASAPSVTELVRARRPQWLRSRGADVLRPSRDPLASSGVRVYLNGGLLGGLETLDQVSVYAVTRVEFFDAAAAILRWGAGHNDGAILLTTGAAP